MRGLLFLCCVMASAVQAAPREDFADSTVTVKPTKLWTEPGQFGEATALLDPGLRLEVLNFNTSSDWVQVRTPSGREGWIPVRLTALSGRRSDPLISGQNARERSPAGTFDAETESSDEASPDSTRPHHRMGRAGRAVRPQGGATHQAGASLEYLQRLTPEAMPGIAVRPNFLFRLAGDWWLGGGLDFSYDGKTTTVLASVMASLKQSHLRLAPVAILRRGFGPLRVDAALGFDLERTSLTTTDLDTGAIIATYNGLRYTGSEWNTALALRLQPTYVFPLDGGSSLGLTLSWSLRADLSSGQGTFAGNPGSGYNHGLGVGLAYASEF